jgi:ribosomal protein L24E
VRRTPRPSLRAGLALVATALLAALPVVSPSPQGAIALTQESAPKPGYWLVGSDGSVYSYGSAGALGSLRGTPLSRPIAGMAPTPSGAGYWLVGTDGGIFSYGDAKFHGSTGAVNLNKPIVGMAATPTGNGYWFVASDGGIFTFGDAKFYGSTGAVNLNKPIVGMAATPTGNGYWFVASDGGIFSFGDAKFYGSTGNVNLNKPIVGMAATPSGNGYWFVASDGGIFTFGDAKFHGSTGDVKLAKPIVGMAASPSGQGYWFVASDGGIFNFGDASFLGSAGGSSLPAGIVVMAGVNPAGASTSGTDPSATTAPTGPTSTQPTTPTTTAGPPPTGEAFQMALIGDSGYAAGQDEVFDRMVQHMNAAPLAFVVHDGDFKDPMPACSDSRFTRVKEAFNKSKAPFVYTPGDNEWMDCMTNQADPKNPLERLGKLREMFFAQDQSLGQNPMPLTTQRAENYPENARWTKEGVVFATLNAPGPTDNLPWDVDNPSTPEAGPRRVANLAWLRQTFETAKATNAPAVMIIWQADPWTPTFRRTWDYLMDELRAQTLAFGKPVVLVHGDTHIHHIDKGGWQTKAGAMDATWDDVPNFTRVETWAAGSYSGSNTETHPDMWIRVTVDPKSPQVFTFTDETAP